MKSIATPILALAALASLPVSAARDLVVIASTADAQPPGTLLSSGDTIELGVDHRLMLLADGSRYTARVDISPKVRALTLHRVAAGLDTDAGRLAWLAERGCLRQAPGLLGDLARRAMAIDYLR